MSYVYLVTYWTIWGVKKTATVEAETAIEARRKAKAADPFYTATSTSPRRLRPVTA